MGQAHAQSRSIYASMCTWLRGIRRISHSHAGWSDLLAHIERSLAGAGLSTIPTYALMHRSYGPSPRILDRKPSCASQPACCPPCPDSTISSGRDISNGRWLVASHGLVTKLHHSSAGMLRGNDACRGRVGPRCASHKRLRIVSVMYCTNNRACVRTVLSSPPSSNAPTGGHSSGCAKSWGFTGHPNAEITTTPQIKALDTYIPMHIRVSLQRRLVLPLAATIQPRPK